MKRINGLVVYMILTAGSVFGQSDFTSIDDANKAAPLGSLISGPTSLGVGGNVVNPFTGSVSLSLPILPGITLSYSSINVPLLMNYENRDMQSSTVGAGWLLELGSIIADLKGTTDITDDDWYYIGSGGSRTKIMKDASGIYRLQNNPYWKVELSMRGELVDGITFTTDDGSKMMFGDFNDGGSSLIGPQKANRCVLHWGPRVADFCSVSGADQICYRWDLSEVQDPYGVVLADIYYVQEQSAVNGVNYTRASYPDHILNRRTDQKIEFSYSARDPREYQIVDPTSSRIQFYETYSLSQITAYPSAQSSESILKFDFGTQDIPNGTNTKHLLPSIIQRGRDNSLLPSMKFGYDVNGQYILKSVLDPRGGLVTINGNFQSYEYLSQTSDAAATILNGVSGMPEDSYRVSASGATIARFDLNNGRLNIERWVGKWISCTHDVANPKSNTGCNRASVSVSDNHIALVYKQANGLDRLLMFDWKEEELTWDIGLNISANSLQAYYDALLATLSRSGCHLAIYAADSIHTDPASGFPGLWSWQYCGMQRQWQPTGSISGPQIGGGDHDWYVQSLTATENMVLLQNQDGTCVYQFGAPGDPQMRFVFSDAWNDGVRRFFLTDNYIGYWDTGNGQLRTENFILDPMGNVAISEQYLGDFHAGDYDRRTTYPVFTDDRILLCEYSGATTTQEMRANIRIWAWNGTGFSTVQSIWTDVGAAGDAAPYYWYNTRFYGIDNYKWDLNCRISNDWVFVFQHRSGGSSEYNPFEGRVWAYMWNNGSSRYEEAGTYSYPFAQESNYYGMFVSSDLVLTDDHFTVTSDGYAAIGSYPTRNGFTDVFPLDRTSAASWSTSRYQLLSENNYYSYKSGGTCLLAGNNFIGVGSLNDGEVKVKSYHNADKNWGNGVTAFTVSRVSTSGSIGPDVYSDYTYDSQLSFDPYLVAPGFASGTTSNGQNGSTKTYFNYSLESPLLRGLVAKTEAFAQGNPTAIQRWIPTWSVYQDPFSSYLLQIRKTFEINMLDGMENSTRYDYNNTNGQIMRITEQADAVSDLGGTHNRVTDITFGFQQYPSMATANMLVQPYQTGVSAFSASDGISHVLSLNRTEYDAKNYPFRSLVYDGANWIVENTVLRRDNKGSVVESQDVMGVHSTTKYGHNGTLPFAEIVNAGDGETGFLGFEDGWEDWEPAGTIVTNQSHTGTSSAYCNNACGPTKNFLCANGVDKSKSYTLEAWVKVSSGTGTMTIEKRDGSGSFMSSVSKTFSSSGGPGWQHVSLTISPPQMSDLPVNGYLRVWCGFPSSSSNAGYVDDIRFGPARATMNTYTYNPLTLQMTTKTDVNGVSTYYAYDAFGRPTDTRNDDGNVISHTEYYSSRNAGNNYVFDPAHPNFVRTTSYPNSDGSNPVISTTYTDGLGRTLQTHSRFGSTDIISAFEYDDAGRPYHTWRPYSGSTEYDPSYAANVQSVYGGVCSNPYDETIYYQDPLSRVHFTKPSGWTTENEWTENKYGSATVNGSLFSFSETLQKVGSNIGGRTGSRIYSDKLGRAVRQETYVEGAAAVASTTTYNMLGKPVATVDPNGYVSTNVYNTFLGTLARATTVDNGTSDYLYDTAGRLRFMVDAVGSASSPNKTLYWKYDIFGRVIEKGFVLQNWTDMPSHVNDQSYPSTPATWRKKYDYDNAGITEYATGRLCRVQTNNDDDFAAEAQEDFRYDKYGNVLSVTTTVPEFSAGSYTISYVYDLSGRVIEIRYPSLQVTQAQNFTVTPSNPYAASSASTLTVGPAFVVESGAIATVAAKESVRLIPGFKASAGAHFRAWIDPNIIGGGTVAMTVKYRYDQLGRVTDIGDGSDDDFYAHYDYNNPGGGMSQERLNNQGSTTSYQYGSSRGFLTQISHTAFAENVAYSGGFGGSDYYNGSIARDSFTYPASWPVSYTYNFRYNEHNRMIVADNTAGSYSDYDYGVTGPIQYDNNGNMISRPMGSSGQNTFVYYPGTNRLMNTNGNTNDHVLQYDASGNLVSNAARGISLSYDPFTQLMSSVSGNDANVTFQYDGRKERILKTVSKSGSVTSTLYLRGTNEYPLTEKIGNGGSTTDRFYVYGPTGLVAVVEGGATYFLVKDRLGSTRAVLNSSNTPVTWFSYDVYGNNIGSLVNQDVKYKFTGQELDAGFASSELYNFRAREYDPRLGTFYAADQAGQGFSPYGYVGGNPVMRTDPTGRIWWLVAAEVIYDIYQAYNAASMVYGAYQAISSGTFENMLRFGMHSAFTIAGMGVSASEPGGSYAADWAERAAVGGGLSVAGYYAGGGQGWRGALGAFAEGAGASLLGMAVQYGKVSEWQMPMPEDPALLSLSDAGMSSPTALTMATKGVEFPEPYWIYSQSSGEWRLMWSNDADILHGYAGAGIGLNNADAEFIHDRLGGNWGPLVRGTYQIGPMKDYRLRSRPGSLSNAMMLTPDPTTARAISSYGRTGPYLVHGARNQHYFKHFLGSEGCPILIYQDRLHVFHSGVQDLRVVR